jgi:hypothetical protein
MRFDEDVPALAVSDELSRYARLGSFTLRLWRHLWLPASGV